MFGNVYSRSAVLSRSKQFSFVYKHVCTSSRFFATKGTSNQHSVADDTPDDSTHFPERATKVLYDGDCHICMKEINILKKIARTRPVDFVDITKMDFQPEKYSGITYEMAMKEMHVIGVEGKVYTQGDAIREMYRACGLGWLAAATQLPGIEPVCNKLYEKFAVYRLQKALDRCDSGSCSVKLKHLRDKLRPQE